MWWADENTRRTLTLNISQKYSGRSWYSFEETQKEMADWRKSHLEDGLVDLGAAAKNLLGKTQVSSEEKKKRKKENSKVNVRR